MNFLSLINNLDTADLFLLLNNFFINKHYYI